MGECGSSYPPFALTIINSWSDHTSIPAQLFYSWLQESWITSVQGCHHCMVFPCWRVQLLLLGYLDAICLQQVIEPPIQIDLWGAQGKLHLGFNAACFIRCTLGTSGVTSRFCLISGSWTCGSAGASWSWTSAMTGSACCSSGGFPLMTLRFVL